MKKIVPFVIILAVLGIALGTFWYLRRAANKPTTAVAGVVASPEASPSGPAEPGAEPAHTHGPADAKVTIEEFGDFQCPPCGRFHPILKQIENEFGNRVQVIFREFPLVPAHEHALAAARAAEAAGLQGRFWEMHDMLYDNQQAWHELFDVRPAFEAYAKKIGLDLARFQKDISSDAVEQRIFQDGKRAHSLNVTGTPTVFLNGRELNFEIVMAPDKFRSAIEAELKGK